MVISNYRYKQEMGNCLQCLLTGFRWSLVIGLDYHTFKHGFCLTHDKKVEHYNSKELSRNGPECKCVLEPGISFIVTFSDHIAVAEVPYMPYIINKNCV